VTLHRRARASVPALAAALALAGCATTTAEAGSTEATATAAAAPGEITVSHAQGETVVPVEPETVLVFDLATLDTLHALDVEVDGMPTANLAGRFADLVTPETIDIGTLFEPDYEAVHAADPDLIVVGGRSAAALPELAKIAPTIDLSTDAEDYLGSVEENARTLGEIFGAQDRVEALLGELDASIATLREDAADAGRGLIVLTSGGEVTAYGPGSRFGWLHDELGVAPARDDIEVSSHGQAVSFEYIRETNPDWLFVVDRDVTVGDAGAAAEVLDNELVAQTTAWSTGQVVYVDAIDWYVAGGGLGTMQRVVDEVAGALNGD
jgi:iron complex transport system substrate-binding protein